MNSKDPYVQALLKEAESHNGSDPDFGDKLTEITRKIAEYQGKLQTKTPAVASGVMTDPADAFVCDGCQ